MEQASISQSRPLSFPHAALAVTSFVAAIVIVTFALMGLSGAGKTDRIMTDEVKKIKVGYTVSGDPKPHGGLPELAQQISAEEYTAAQKTVEGIGRQFSSVTAELERRSVDVAAAGRFSDILNELGSSIGAGDKAGAQSAAGVAAGLWPQIESELSQSQIDSGVMIGSLGSFALAWLLFVIGLVAVSEKGRPAVSREAVSQIIKNRGINIMRFRILRALLASTVFPAALQAVGLIFLIMVFVVGIAGVSENSESMTTILVWSLWWSPLMMIGLVFFGKLWCGACPLGAITAVVERFGAGRRSPVFSRKFSLGLLTVTPLAASVLGFVAMREPLYGSGYAVSSAVPFWTVFYFGVWIVLAVGVSLVYKRRAWCRNWCPVSVATSVVAKLSPLDLAHSNSAGVSNCSTAEYPGNYLSSDKRCIYCMRCTQAYPETPVMARLQLPGASAVRDKKIFAEAVMSIIIVAVFPIGHGLGQLSLFKATTASEMRLGLFTAIIGSLAVYAIISRVAAWLSGQDFRDIFAQFGIAFLPMGVLFSVGQAVTSILGKSGNWLNSVMPFFGIHGYWNPALVEKETIASWQHWSMSWMTMIGGVWALMLIWAIARRQKTPATAWLPMMALTTGIVVLAKILPMPMH